MKKVKIFSKTVDTGDKLIIQDYCRVLAHAKSRSAYAFYIFLATHHCLVGFNAVEHTFNSTFPNRLSHVFSMQTTVAPLPQLLKQNTIEGLMTKHAEPHLLL